MIIPIILAVMACWYLAVHLLRLFGGDARTLAVIDGVLTVVALLVIAVEAHKAGLF